MLEIENARKAEKAKLSGPITIVEDHNEKDVQPEHPSKAIGDDDHEWKQFEEHRRQVTHLLLFCILYRRGQFLLHLIIANVLDLMKEEKNVKFYALFQKDFFSKSLLN